VTSLFLPAFTGLTPVGGWLAGMIAGRYSLFAALLAGGSGMVLVTLFWIWRMKSLRRQFVL
jgi:hypothetical protein